MSIVPSDPYESYKYESKEPTLHGYVETYVYATPKCDFCYSDHQPGWNARLNGPRPLEWHFYICDHCRLLLRNVVSIVLHKLTHTQVVEALTAKMDELGISYDDLMGIVEPKQIGEA